MVETLRQWGLPDLVGCDRDPRWVGAASGRDFPSAFVRMWHCLGVQAYVCPPHRPDKNGCVERYNNSYQYECLLVHYPTDVGQVREGTAQSHQHYNHERPNQAPPCGNRPPRVAFPTLPPRPSLPAFIDPDGWVQAEAFERYARKVTYGGRVKVDEHWYDVQQALGGSYVVLEVDAAKQELVVWHHQEEVKRLPIKGLVKTQFPWEDYVTQLGEEARSEWHRYQQTRVPRHSAR